MDEGTRVRVNESYEEDPGDGDLVGCEGFVIKSNPVLNEVALDNGGPRNSNAYFYFMDEELDIL